ncbi:MAG TPA: hypothetical protein ACFCUD_01085 [Cyclobacteriaceae bacterium]
MKLTSVLTLSMLFSLASYAQSDRVFVGGNLGFGASRNITNINLSPQIGYRVTSRFTMGTGVTYQYIHYRTADLSTSNYGGRLFAQYRFLQNFLAYTEFEHLSFEFPTVLVNGEFQTDRQNYNSYFVGGGYVQSSGRASFFTLVLYNLLYDDNESSPYGSPWVVRGGVNFSIF